MTPQVTALPDTKAQDNLKDGRALRIETVINDAYIGVLRRLEHFGELTTKALTEDGRRARALRFGDLGS